MKCCEFPSEYQVRPKPTRFEYFEYFKPLVFRVSGAIPVREVMEGCGITHFCLVYRALT